MRRRTPTKVRVMQIRIDQRSNTEKMPDCPKCGEDELAMVNSNNAACLRCGYISPDLNDKL
jgi:ribosomal protein S27AE